MDYALSEVHCCQSGPCVSLLVLCVLLSEADTATAAHRVRLCLCLADTVTAMPIGPVRRPPEQSNERPNAWAMAAARPKMGRPRRADRP